MSILAKVGSFMRNVFSKVTPTVNKTLMDLYGVGDARTEFMKHQQERWRKITVGDENWGDKNLISQRTATSIGQKIADFGISGSKIEIVANGERTRNWRVSSEPITNARSIWLNKQLNRAMQKLHAAVWFAANYGEIVMLPVDYQGRTMAKVLEPDSYIPLQYNPLDELIDVVFLSQKKQDKYNYTLFERHRYDAIDQTHTITYDVFKQKENEEMSAQNIGERAALSEVIEWTHLENMTFQNIEQPLFVYIRTPQTDIVEKPQKQGVPIWNTIIPILKKLDELEADVVHEYKQGRLKIEALSHWFTYDELNDRVDFDEDLFMTFIAGGDESFPPTTFNPEFRIDGYLKRKDDLLRQAEDGVGFSRGTLANISRRLLTATEVETTKDRNVVTMEVWQFDVLENAIEHYVKSLDAIATIMGIPDGEYEIIYSWNRSYATTKTRELEQMRVLMREGVLFKDEVRAFALEIPLAQSQQELMARGVDLFFEEENEMGTGETTLDNYNHNVI